MLYIHIPFCFELCPYCSFHRVRFDKTIVHTYFDALERELDFHEEQGAEYRNAYIGGGTPTVLPERLLGLLDSLYRRWPITSISVETNPDFLTHDAPAMLADAGVHRISVGVQSFDDRMLESLNRLDRYGSGSSIAKKIERAATSRIRTFNVDLIFNLPGQTESSIIQDARIVAGLPVDQVTWYPLMPSSPRDMRQSRREYDQYRLIDRLLVDSFRPSSAWCFSRTDTLIDEYIIDEDEYAAAGSGAFGYVGGRIYANTFSIDEYCDSLARRGECNLALLHKFSITERELYRLLMKCFSGRIPPRFEGDFPLRLIRWASLAMGFAEKRGTRRLSNRMAAHLNARSRYWTLVLMREFFTGVNTLRRACLYASEMKPRPKSWTLAAPVAGMKYLK